MLSSAGNLTGLQNCLRHDDFQKLEDVSIRSPEQVQPSPGLASLIKSPMAWSGTETNGKDLHVLQLGPRDIKEIEAALSCFLCEW